MISYAQNREDALLSRAFGSQRQGFYIDVGAHHPTYDSVTKHFYDRGWRGINVEPGRTFAEIAAARPEDINLQAAISDVSGSATYYEFPGTGLSTLSAAEVAIRRGEGREPMAREVESLTLACLCDRHVRGEIDFLSVDVEGYEREVIAGGDWQRWRPRVAVVESTRPNSTEPSHESWEPMLIAADYQFAVFDGLNRFYVRAEEEGLLAALRAPLTVLDQVVPIAHVERVAELQSRVAALEAQIRDIKRANPIGYLLGRALSKSRRWMRAKPPEQPAALAHSANP